MDLDSDDSTVDALQDGTASGCEHVDLLLVAGERLATYGVEGGS